MPTGYTAGVLDGTVPDFRTFALRCARAFGATIMQRDEAMDALPKLREVEAHYESTVREMQNSLARVKGMTPEQIKAESELEYERLVTANRERNARADQAVQRLTDMLAQVQAWEPPTSEHARLKTFMVEQLTTTLQYDGGRYEHKTERLTPAEWYAREIERAYERLGMAERQLVEERERVRLQNEWIRALYASLDHPVEVEA